MSGYIGYYKLGDWWREAFTAAEQEVIAQSWQEALAKAPPTVLTPDDIDAIADEDAPHAAPVTLTSGAVTYIDLSRLAFLRALHSQLQASHPRLAPLVRAKIDAIESENE